MIDKQVDQAWLEALLALFCQQRALVPGEVPSATFRVLVELGRVRNSRILNAMEAHLVQGWAREEASAMYGVSPGYLSRRLADLNRVWQLTEILRMNRENTTQGGEPQGGNHDTTEM
ncbi:PapB/FocB family fimbrial expression transcriptional regulator [Salmonella enterica]|uniref:PapB/FocB family fimbrial expression transcriptional regulator n=1 Tax=Salmonella enterica TaxID=28901 RepID=UPI0009AD347D|nr:PapB/FocB family fimbrial expression transcriptional regulator [Salmonella enterica]